MVVMLLRVFACFFFTVASVHRAEIRALRTRTTRYKFTKTQHENGNSLYTDSVGLGTRGRPSGSRVSRGRDLGPVSMDKVRETAYL